MYYSWQCVPVVNVFQLSICSSCQYVPVVNVFQLWMYYSCQCVPVVNALQLPMCSSCQCVTVVSVPVVRVSQLFVFQLECPSCHCPRCLCASNAMPSVIHAVTDAVTSKQSKFSIAYILYIYIYLKTTEKLNTSQITLVEKYNLIEIVEGQVTKRLGLALFIQ